MWGLDWLFLYQGDVATVMVIALSMGGECCVSNQTCPMSQMLLNVRWEWRRRGGGGVGGGVLPLSLWPSAVPPPPPSSPPPPLLWWLQTPR